MVLSLVRIFSFVILEIYGIKLSFTHRIGPIISWSLAAILYALAYTATNFWWHNQLMLIRGLASCKCTRPLPPLLFQGWKLWENLSWCVFSAYFGDRLIGGNLMINLSSISQIANKTKIVWRNIYGVTSLWYACGDSCHSYIACMMHLGMVNEPSDSLACENGA